MGRQYEIILILNPKVNKKKKNEIIKRIFNNFPEVQEIIINLECNIKRTEKRLRNASIREKSEITRLVESQSQE